MSTKIKVILGLVLAVSWLALGQTGTPVRVSDDPSASSVTVVPVIGGTGEQTVGVCSALSAVTTGSRTRNHVSISAATNASPVVFTSTGHGFPLWMRPQVTISGATGNWTPVNGTFTATVVDADSFSIPVDSGAFSTLTGTLTFTTTAPRTTVAEWAVSVIHYDAAGTVDGRAWLGGSSSYNSKCSDATSSSVNLQ